MIDLHCHTKVSDGALSPAELVERAYSEGLTALAITDHDTIGGIDEALEATKQFPLELIPGIELSCGHGDYITEIHLIGLFIDTKSTPFNELLKRLRKFRADRNRRMMENLQAQGVEISLADFKANEYTSYKELDSLGKPNFAYMLMKKGYVKSPMEGMIKYLDDKVGLASTEKEKISVKEAIEAVHEAGGLSILAHPHLIMKEMGKFEIFDSFVTELKEYGLDGMEVFYNKYKKKMIKELKRVCRQQGLCLSGGSDFHSDSFRSSQLGYYGVKKNIPTDLVEKMRRYL